MTTKTTIAEALEALDALCEVYPGMRSTASEHTIRSALTDAAAEVECARQKAMSKPMDSMRRAVTAVNMTNANSVLSLLEERDDLKAELRAARAVVDAALAWNDCDRRLEIEQAELTLAAACDEYRAAVKARAT